MISRIISFFEQTVYVQLWHNRLKITDVKTGKQFDQAPYIAYEKSDPNNIKSIGDSAAYMDSPFVKFINPFLHERMLVSDFVLAEKVISYGIRQVFRNQLFSISPRVVFQPMEKTEGGITSVESRMYTELILGAGGREVVVYNGPAFRIDNFNYKLAKDNSISAIKLGGVS